MKNLIAVFGMLALCLTAQADEPCPYSKKVSKSDPKPDQPRVEVTEITGPESRVETIRTETVRETPSKPSQELRVEVEKKETVRAPSTETIETRRVEVREVTPSESARVPSPAESTYDSDAATPRTVRPISDGVRIPDPVEPSRKDTPPLDSDASTKKQNTTLEDGVKIPEPQNTTAEPRSDTEPAKQDPAVQREN